MTRQEAEKDWYSTPWRGDRKGKPAQPALSLPDAGGLDTRRRIASQGNVTIIHLTTDRIHVVAELFTFRVPIDPHWRVTLATMKRCEQCGGRLPWAMRNGGPAMIYCSNACRQKAYRARGGRASGTTGAERWRRGERPR